MQKLSARIAIACSGLGHIQRGIETWAYDLANALRSQSQQVTLFGGAPSPGIAAVPCLRRAEKCTIRLAKIFRQIGGWRYGMGSPYDIEQTTFSAALSHRLRHYDLIHAQDPHIALWFERARRLGLSRAHVIYTNGTGEGPEFMKCFSNIQLLTPGAYEAWQFHALPNQQVFMIPNFINLDRFAPGDAGLARHKFALPSDATIILSCAAIRRPHKRIDYLIDEFSSFINNSNTNAILVIAGAREAETDELISYGHRILGDRVHFFTDVSRDDMPDLYRAADVFTLVSLYEMFGIVLLEAIASGVPVVCNDTSDFRSIAGPGGIFMPLDMKGGLAAGLAQLSDANRRRAVGSAGRSHVEQKFSDVAVVRDIIAMYDAVLNRK